MRRLRAHHHRHAQPDAGRARCHRSFSTQSAGCWSYTMIAPRSAEIIRHTTETQIELHLTIEGQGRYKVSTGIRFFDHMLELFTRHGGFDLDLKCDGDLDVDQH